MEFNKYQTDYSYLKKEDPKVFALIDEAVNTIPFMRHCMGDEKVRKYAKDLKRDDKGRVIVDVTKPHLIEDMDYFRERAIFYEKHGKYTNLFPSKNPFGAYKKFWAEEKRRFKEGYVRESDGEWVPGYLYFYWNYSPIWQAAQDADTAAAGGKEADRVRKFPQPYLGDYLFFHYIDQARKAGKHTKMLKSRGIGMSFKAGAFGPCNMIIKPGTGNPNVYLASDKTFLSGDKGVFGKVVDVLDWLAETTPFPRMRLINSIRSMEIQLGYYNENGNRAGNLASVYGISLKDNPDKARGIRGPFIFYEEDGLFPNLEKAWNVNRPGMEAGGLATGLMFAGGTGGTEGASFEGSKKLFYSPEAYNIYGIPNYYDKNINGTLKCGFFWGAYMNREGCTHPNGEVDIAKALIEIMTERVLIIKSSNDPAAITQKKAENPLTPDEAIMRTTGALFPVADISEYMNHINANKDKFLSSLYYGKLVYGTDGEVKFLPDPDSFPIRSLDIQGNRSGSVEIFEMPKTIRGSQTVAGRYIAGIDPIDQDVGPSLFCITVLDTFTDRLVAQYIGRYPKAEQCYEIALKLLKFYGAKANYENNLKGLYSYFKYKNSLVYLADTPEILKDMDMMKPSANTNKGTRATAPINAWGRQLQVSWMLTKVKDTEDDEEETKLKLHEIKSLRYLEEAAAWHPDGNYDMVSAMGMLFIYREEILKRSEKLKEDFQETKNSFLSSPFFGEKHSNESIISRYKWKSEE